MIRSHESNATFHCLLRGILLSIFLLPACSVISDPDPPVADSTLVDVMIEFHLAGARADLGYDLPPALRDSILTAYGLDSTVYASAAAFYAEHPQAYLTLYNQVLDRLSAERAAETDFNPADLPGQSGASSPPSE